MRQPEVEQELWIVNVVSGHYAHKMMRQQQQQLEIVQVVEGFEVVVVQCLSVELAVEFDDRNELVVDVVDSVFDDGDDAANEMLTRRYLMAMVHLMELHFATADENECKSYSSQSDSLI